METHWNKEETKSIDSHQEAAYSTQVRLDDAIHKCTFYYGVAEQITVHSSDSRASVIKTLNVVLFIISLNTGQIIDVWITRYRYSLMRA